MFANLKDAHIFWVINVMAFCLLLVVYPFTMVGGDEGRFVQDALRIGRGEIPIADYGTRAPILSFFIYSFTELLGRSLFVFRLPVMVFSALTAGFIFLLGKEIFYRNVGILASLIFATVPFTLWHNAVIKSEALEILLVTVSAWLFVRGMQTNTAALFLYAGMCIGIAFIERQSVVAFMLASALVVIGHAFQKKESLAAQLRDVVRKGTLLVSGVILGILPVFLFVASHDSTRALQHWFNIYASVGPSLEEKEIEAGNALSPVYQFLRSWALMFVEKVAVQAGVVYAGFMIFLMGFAQLFLKENSHVRKIVLGGIIVLSAGSLLFHSLKIVSVGTFRPYVFLSLVIFFVPLLLWFWYTLLDRKILCEAMRDYKNSLPFLVIWVISLMIAYSFYIPGYPREFMPVFSLMTAFVLASVPWRVMSKNALLVFGGCVMGLTAVGIAWFHNPIIGWWWQQETIKQTTAFIQARTQPGDLVFSANPLPVILANRAVVADINPYAIYFATDVNSSFGGFPSPRAYHELLQADPPPYAIVDGRMEHHFFEKYPFFEEFVKTNYKRVATFGTGYKRDWTEVWELIK